MWSWLLTSVYHWGLVYVELWLHMHLLSKVLGTSMTLTIYIFVKLCVVGVTISNEQGEGMTGIGYSMLKKMRLEIAILWQNWKIPIFLLCKFQVWQIFGCYYFIYIKSVRYYFKVNLMRIGPCIILIFE